MTNKELQEQINKKAPAYRVDDIEQELQKLNNAQAYLNEIGIYDRESFFEFLNES